MLLTSARVHADRLAELGWESKPEGLCRGHECVPLPAGSIEADNSVDAALVSTRLRRSFVADVEQGLWAIGPEHGTTTLTSVVAPELELPDLRTGETLRLSSLRGKKVVLASWASW